MVDYLDILKCSFVGMIVMFFATVILAIVITDITTAIIAGVINAFIIYIAVIINVWLTSR